MSRPEPAGIIFDFGGVLWNMRWDVCRDLESTHGLPDGAIVRTLYGSDAWRGVERGRGDLDAWREEAHRALEALAARALPRLHDLWRAAQAPIVENIALVRTLRPPYWLAILSNADRTLWERLRDRVAIHDLFDDIVCSAEVGIAKPEPGIYALASERLRLPPEACVFVDDHEPNVRAAEAAGLAAVLHRIDRGDDLRAQFAAMGIRPRLSLVER